MGLRVISKGLWRGELRSSEKEADDDGRIAVKGPAQMDAVAQCVNCNSQGGWSTAGQRGAAGGQVRLESSLGRGKDLVTSMEQQAL